MNLSPRCIQILLLFLQSKDYINLEKITFEFKISMRTLFRELNLIKIEIFKYGLDLEKKSKFGIKILGNEESKQELIKKLQMKEIFDPKNKDKRRKKLITELLKIDEIMKIYYFADKLQASEATISQDLEKIEKWFSKYNIEILRKKGSGIELKYKELDFRKALIAYMEQEKQLIMITEEEKDEIKNIVEKIEPEIKKYLTIESYETFLKYLTIAVKRTKESKSISSDLEIEENYDLESYNKINLILTNLEKNYNIKFDLSEKNAAYIYYKSRKIGYFSQKNEEELNMKESEILNLISKMIDKFDIKIAHELKSDTEFIKGLLIHLKPALIRLKHKIPVQNHLKEEIIELYPDIYKKTKNAVTVLETILNRSVSDDETAYLAFHFGSAVIRLNYLKNKQRIVKIGVVCGSGIGVSSLLSSRLKNIFKERIKVKTFSNDIDKYNEFKETDFLVTTFDLENIEIPVIKVDAIIKNEQLDKISELIDYYMHEKEKLETTVQEKKDAFYETLSITEEINSILANFSVFVMNKNLTLTDLMKEISKISGETEEESEKIYEALLEREKRYTQVLEEFEFTFLHSKIHKIKNSIFYIIKPDGEYFTNQQLKKSKVVVVMFLNEEKREKRPAISVISESIFENENFYLKILKADEEGIKKDIEKILADYLKSYINKNYN